MHLAGGVEITWQVILGVVPPIRAVDINLTAADRVAQRDQHTQLVRDALDAALLVDDRPTPRLGTTPGRPLGPPDPATRLL